MRQHKRIATLLALLGTASLLPACATFNDEALKTDRLELGRNADGDPCTATYSRQDDTLADVSDASFAMTCRGATSSRSIGFLRTTPSADTLAKVEQTLSCGAPTPVTLSGIGVASARRCNDKAVGAETVVVSFERGDRTFIGSAQPGAAGPLVDGLRQLVAGVMVGNADRATEPGFDFASLAAPPATQAASADASAEFDPAVALRNGTALNQRGLHAEASRLLNDALSRIDESVPATTRAELYLEAGLADSNIRFREAAIQRFEEADRIIAAANLSDPVLLRKRDTFRALDLLNRRDFRNALAALDRLLTAQGTGADPLTDPIILNSLNQTPQAQQRRAAGAIAPSRTEQQLQLMLNVQAHLARSNALRTLGQQQEAQAALNRAFETFNSIVPGGPAQAQILWLKARLERQRGRLAAARGDWAASNQAFEAAVAALEEGGAASNWTGREPAFADAMLERATMRARSGAPAEEARKLFVEAVDAMVAAKAAGSIDPTGIERYLDLLVEEAKSSPREDTYELYFRALQAIGEPAVARQLNQLQSVVSADPELGVKFRERDDLERQLTALRYQISAAPEAERPALEQQRAEAQAKLDALGVELAANARASSIDDRPATLAEIRGALRPGEAYLKVTPLNRRAYGLVVDQQRTLIYPIDAPLAVMSQLASEIRTSIDGGLDTERRDIPRFKVGEAHALFTLLAGPAADTLLGATAIVVEPSGPLERLPIGVLITDRASVQRYRPRSRSRNISEAYNYSDLSFLASRAELSTAVSPRSFLVARSRTPSNAAQPFIGFAEHSPQSGANLPSSGEVRVGEACFADANRLRELMASAPPIEREEVAVAKAALGVPQAPVMAGAEFTDVSVQQRSDLDQYQVLHFATHGLEEGMFGCAKSPPALLTSIDDANSDGLLSFDEIAGLRLDANLVVLSACETASGASQELARQSGQEEGGSTLEGLVRAFLTANSRAVLATYWQVSAASETDELVRTFYSSARGANIGSSLRAAQQELMRQPEYSHPFYWGAYFVVGDSSKMMLSQPGQQVASR